MSNDLKLQGTIKQKAVLAGKVGKRAKLQGNIKTPVSREALQFEIELSTDMENPTELLDYIDKSGIYVAKNTGIIGIGGEPFTILAQGQFFEVQNFKDLAEVLGEEITDEENMINIAIPSIEGYIYYLKINNGGFYDSVNITSENINDYINIDTSNLIQRYQINSAYGIQLMNNQLAIVGATQNEIERGQALYKPITPYTIAYAVKNKGELYFPTKEEFNDLKTDTENLISEIESILDTVVSVNE